jgi:predicted ArsR family transcriptional regulator
MDRLHAIGIPELREALTFVRASNGPVTADDLAARLGVHRNVARSRLERLVEASLLDAAFERRTGRSGPGAGRPARTYSTTPELSAIEFPPRRYGSLIGLLLESLPRRGRSRRLAEVGVSFGQEFARSVDLPETRNLPDAVRAVCVALGESGFHATVEEAREDEAWIRTATCPMRPLVVANPEVVAVDPGMWAGLVGATLRGIELLEIECSTHDCLNERDACRVCVRVHPHASSGRSAGSKKGGEACSESSAAQGSRSRCSPTCHRSLISARNTVLRVSAAEPG